MPGDALAHAPGGPTVALTTPAEAAEVTAPLELRGTVDSDNLAGWRLGYRNVDDDTLTRLGEGSTAVVDGVLGHLDPTLLINGQYRLVLEA